MFNRFNMTTTQRGTRVGSFPPQLGTKLIIQNIGPKFGPIISRLLTPQAQSFLSAARQASSLSSIDYVTAHRDTEWGRFRYVSQRIGVVSDDTLYISPSPLALEKLNPLLTDAPGANLTPCVVVHLLDQNYSDGFAEPDLTPESYSVRVGIRSATSDPYKYSYPFGDPYELSVLNGNEFMPPWFNKVLRFTSARETRRTNGPLETDSRGYSYLPKYPKFEPSVYDRRGAQHRIFINTTADEFNRYLGDGGVLETSPNLRVGGANELINYYRYGAEWVDHFVSVTDTSIDYSKDQVVSIVPVSDNYNTLRSTWFFPQILTYTQTIGFRTAFGNFIPLRRVVGDLSDIRYMNFGAPIYADTFPWDFLGYADNTLLVGALQIFSPKAQLANEEWLRINRVPEPFASYLWWNRYPDDTLDPATQVTVEARALDLALLLADPSKLFQVSGQLGYEIPKLAGELQDRIDFSPPP